MRGELKGSRPHSLLYRVIGPSAMLGRLKGCAENFGTTPLAVLRRWETGTRRQQLDAAWIRRKHPELIRLWSDPSAARQP